VSLCLLYQVFAICSSDTNNNFYHLKQVVVDLFNSTGPWTQGFMIASHWAMTAAPDFSNIGNSPQTPSHQPLPRPWVLGLQRSLTRKGSRKEWTRQDIRKDTLTQEGNGKTHIERAGPAGWWSTGKILFFSASFTQKRKRLKHQNTLLT
jgi:hypothetical protein